jgi:hypothetical protein
VRAVSFEKVPKCDWHGPRSHINYVLPIKTADQVPAEIVQIGIEHDGNPRPLLVVAKNLAVANYGDILAGIRIDNIAVEHFFSVLRVRCHVYQLPTWPRCSGCGAIFHGCLLLEAAPPPTASPLPLIDVDEFRRRRRESERAARLNELGRRNAEAWRDQSGLIAGNKRLKDADFGGGW